MVSNTILKDVGTLVGMYLQYVFLDRYYIKFIYDINGRHNQYFITIGDISRP